MVSTFMPGYVLPDAFFMQQLDYPEHRICFGCDDSCYTAWLCIASGSQWHLLVSA